MVYLCSAKENSMDFDEFYRALERLKKDGETVNAYGGSEKDIDHPDGRSEEHTSELQSQR